MTCQTRAAEPPEPPVSSLAAPSPKLERLDRWLLLTIVALLAVCYSRVLAELRGSWDRVDSYYSHGYLIPPVSLYFAWAQRSVLRALPRRPSGWGYVLLGASCAALLAAEGLGLRVVGQLSLLTALAGLVLSLYGARHLRALWFPLVFLLFMVPIPASLTQSVSLHIKLLATEGAVRLARVFTLPIVRDGSFVVFGTDRLLIGEVCGGLRSMIALLALGALMSYMAKVRLWAKWFLLALSAPIAVVSNILRILVLCVVGYLWGSENATGWVHDISGFLIFVAAFTLFFFCERVLHRWAPARAGEGGRP